MTDEHFMRQWTAGHRQLSADIDSGLAKLRRIIEAAYGEPTDATRASTERPGRAMLAGLAASGLTTLLFASTVMVVTSGSALV